jgi:prepilin-type N-terminal cleavage/methylation domain-containing protein
MRYYPRQPDAAGPQLDVRLHASHKAFTLVELLVVIVILSILASLSLAGLAGARQRAKADKTRSTIRKIDAVIRPMYDSFTTRRTTNAANALTLLVTKRTLLQYEMPDKWSEVPGSDAEYNALTAVAKTATVRAYKTFRSAQATISPAYGPAECLYMVVARSGFEPDALEMFRADEIGDTDLALNGTSRGDGAPEFVDGWGRPIAFMRWAPGWSQDAAPVNISIASQWSATVQSTTAVTLPRRLSPLQIADRINYHDPLDPSRVDANAYALVPLIYSAGPDGALDSPDAFSGTTMLTPGYGLLPPALPNMADLCGFSGTAPNGSPDTTAAYADNITNHDLNRR